MDFYRPNIMFIRNQKNIERKLFNELLDSVKLTNECSVTENWLLSNMTRVEMSKLTVEEKTERIRLQKHRSYKKWKESRKKKVRDLNKKFRENNRETDFLGVRRIKTNKPTDYYIYIFLLITTRIILVSNHRI